MGPLEHSPDLENLPKREISSLASRRHFVIGGALAAASGLAAMRMPKPVNPRIAKKDFTSWMPNKVGDWSYITASGVVLPPPDALSDRLYDDLVSRVYQAPDLPVVMLVFAYNNVQDGVLQLHRPEVCYPAGGYTLSPTRVIEVQSQKKRITANFFSAQGYDRTEQVLYWTRVGDKFPLSWAQQRLAVAQANIQGEIPDGMLARISVIGNEAEAALPVLQKFVSEFERAAPPPLRKLLLG